MTTLKYRDPVDGQMKALAGGVQSHAALTGLGAADAHSQYYTPAGADAVYYGQSGGGHGNAAPADSNRLTGQLSVESANPYLYIHNPGHTHIRVEPGSLGGYTMRVCDPSDRTLRGIIVGTDVARSDTLVPWSGAVAELTDRVSGPHGPHAHWHAGGEGWWNPYPSGALWYPVINIPGMWKIQITADLYIDQAHSVGSLPEVFMGINARWNIDGDAPWNNGIIAGPLGRLSVLGYGYAQLQTATVVAYVPNRIGQQLVACGAAQAQGGGNIRYIGGDYKHTFEFFPYGSNWSHHQYGWG